MIRRRRDQRQRSSRPKGEWRAMTICISALAENGKAIVCVADKMLSFSNPLGDFVQWESDVTKIIPIQKTSVNALIAGGMGQCEAILSGLIGIHKPDDDVTSLMTSLETVYKDNYSHFQEIDVLHKRGITKEAYHSAIISAALSTLTAEIVDDMKNYAFDCDIILCGINDSYRPYIISVASPGHVNDSTRQGFASIGIASDIANSRMLWSGYKREHTIGRVLFDVFDAKANAEMSPGVGFSWDAIVTFSDDGKTYIVPKKVKQLIERAWDQHNRSPFEEWDADEDLPLPEEGWKELILSLNKNDFEEFKPTSARPLRGDLP